MQPVAESMQAERRPAMTSQEQRDTRDTRRRNLSSIHKLEQFKLARTCFLLGTWLCPKRNSAASAGTSYAQEQPLAAPQPCSTAARAQTWAHGKRRACPISGCVCVFFVCVMFANFCYYTHTHTHKRARARAHTHTHTHTHKHTHTHTHRRENARLLRIRQRLPKEKLVILSLGVTVAMLLSSCTLHPTPYTLHPTPYTLKKNARYEIPTLGKGRVCEICARHGRGWCGKER